MRKVICLNFQIHFPNKTITILDLMVMFNEVVFLNKELILNQECNHPSIYSFLHSFILSHNMSYSEGLTTTFFPSPIPVIYSNLLYMSSYCIRIRNFVFGLNYFLFFDFPSYSCRKTSSLKRKKHFFSS